MSHSGVDDQENSHKNEPERAMVDAGKQSWQMAAQQATYPLQLGAVFTGWGQTTTTGTIHQGVVQPGPYQEGTDSIFAPRHRHTGA